MGSRRWAKLENNWLIVSSVIEWWNHHYIEASAFKLSGWRMRCLWIFWKCIDSVGWSYCHANVYLYELKWTEPTCLIWWINEYYLYRISSFSCMQKAIVACALCVIVHLILKYIHIDSIQKVPGEAFLLLTMNRIRSMMCWNSRERR